jgi:1,4-dihydroxy-2-naphthoyl-CoA hydrolase
VVEGIDFCDTVGSVFIESAKITIDALNERCRNTMNTALGIEFTAFGDDFLEATMPVNENTIQPLGMLNGGASLAMIECVGSMAANMALDRSRFVAVGQTVSCSHFKSAYSGDTVTAKAMPLHLGRSSQVWEISITDGSQKLICKGSITMAVISLERTSG